MSLQSESKSGESICALAAEKERSKTNMRPSES